MNQHLSSADLLVAQATEAASVLRAIAHEGRLRVLCYLAVDGELSAGELTRRVGLSQSALSQHLAKLRDQGMVETRKDAQTVFYRVADQRIERLLKSLQEIFCTVLHPADKSGQRS